MHRISKIKIENYKSIVNAEFPLSAYTPLVGYNNAGKTNILQALSWVIKKTSLPGTDFHDPALPIVVTAKISGIDADVLDALEQSHRNRIEPLVVDGSISLRRTQAEPGIGVGGIRLEILQIENNEEQWVINPAGIDQAINRMFPDPIFIGAMENATEDVAKFASGTTIGKLIKEIIGPVAERNAGPVSDALAQVASRLSADGEEKDQALVDLDEQIDVELSKFFPGVRAKIHIQTPEFADFLKNATIKIYDQNYDHANGRDASSFGHGAQRTVQIALIKCLSELKRAAGGHAARTTLLLIDEPELFLHPQAIEIVRASLSRLSEEGYQIAFSTHSPNMISRNDASNALLVRRSVEHGTTTFPRLSDAVLDAIAGADHQSETLFTLTNSSKVLFCEKVILAEGKTERALLPEIYSFEHEATMDENKLGLVELGGADNVPNAMTVLRTMGIPTKAVVDLDFAFRGAVIHGLIEADHDSLEECKLIFHRLANAGQIVLDDNTSLPQNGNGVTAAAAFELLAAEADAQGHIDAIHNHLLENNVWCWKNGTIETHLGLESKKSAAHHAFLNQYQSEDYRDGLPDYPGVRALMDWLND
ncbi:MAG: AAA family ATPase [Rhodobacteraceae bacterium]|nr:AAA family ATPase [Paracoccaceae bacterium]